MDVLDPRVESTIIGWLKSGSVWCLWLGTPCTRWSVARTTSRPGSKTDVSGMGCAQVTRRLVQLCQKLRIPFVIENPRDSKLWDWPPLRRLLSRA
eukprot:4976893-Heterocapsa_arctica.AAC.1